MTEMKTISALIYFLKEKCRERGWKNEQNPGGLDQEVFDKEINIAIKFIKTNFKKQEFKRKKKAFKLTYDCWVWLSENPDKKWEDSPLWDSLSYLTNHDAFCEYRDPPKKFWHKCSACYLYNGYYCGESGSLFNNWKHGGGLSDRVTAAKIIVKKTKKYMKKEGMWDE